jgi:hypothetical protein
VLDACDAFGVWFDVYIREASGGVQVCVRYSYHEPWYGAIFLVPGTLFSYRELRYILVPTVLKFHVPPCIDLGTFVTTVFMRPGGWM